MELLSATVGENIIMFIRNENIITKITDSENAAMVSILPTTSYEGNKLYKNQFLR